MAILIIQTFMINESVLTLSLEKKFCTDISGK